MTNLYILLPAMALAFSTAAIAQVGPRPGSGIDARKWAIEKDPAISITASAEKNSIKAGSELWVDVVLKNISTQDLNVETGFAAEYYYRIQVLGQQGAAVPFTRYGDPDPQKHFWRGKVIGESLKPGWTLKDRLLISKWWDVGKPGTYSILVQRRDGASHQMVKAAPANVTVTE